MRIRQVALLSFVLAAGGELPLVRADSLALKNSETLTGTVIGLRNGQVAITIDGVQRLIELGQVQVISVDAVPKFAEAEQARLAKTPLQGVALYKQLIPALNKPELKLLAQMRAIEPLDGDGRWGEAVALFLEVYAAAPSDSVWQARPARFPTAGSKLLTDSADLVVAAVASAKSDEARKNLKLFLLDIYTKSGNVAQAERLASELTTGIAAPAPVQGAAAGAPANAAADAAIQDFSTQAQSEEAANRPERAVAIWLRIPAHYPDSPAAPAALLRAGQLQQKLNRPQAAQALFQEILTRYPTSKEAVVAKQEVGR